MKTSQRGDLGYFNWQATSCALQYHDLQSGGLENSSLQSLTYVLLKDHLGDFSLEAIQLLRSHKIVLFWNPPSPLICTYPERRD